MTASADYHLSLSTSQKVSFVVAVYKVEQYIEQCVRSLCEQTWEDIEIVLVDDCSPDNSMEIALRVLDDYPQRKQQTKIVRHEENIGVKMVRRDGIKVAEGEYIINIDADDWVEPRMAELMVGKAVEADADMVLCGFWWHRQSSPRYTMPVPMEAMRDSGAIKDATLDRRGWPNVWCRMVKRTLFESEEMVWPVANHPEDLVITTAVTYLAQRLVCVEEPLYHYRYNPNSMTNYEGQEFARRKHADFLQNNELLVQFYERHGTDRKYRHGIMVDKVYAKNETLLLTQGRKRRRLWRKCYPELNRILLRGDADYPSTYREKVWCVALVLGLYPKYKKILTSKRLCPAAIWRVGLPK